MTSWAQAVWALQLSVRKCSSSRGLLLTANRWEACRRETVLPNKVAPGCFSKAEQHESLMDQV